MTATDRKRCLVTGANGFIGSFLVERLVEDGHEVRILCRTTSDLSNLAAVEGKFEKVIGDITDEASVKEAAAGCHWVFHIAGLTAAPTEERFMQVNGEGTATVFRGTKEAAADTLERFVYVCSQAAAGPASDRHTPITEDMEPRPMSQYGRSKRLGEERIAELDAADSSRDWPWVILRPTAVYGPRDKDILAFYQMVNSGMGLFGMRPYFGIPSTMTCMVHAKDVVQACIDAATAPAENVVGETFFIANPGTHHVADLMKRIQTALGKKIVIPVFVPLFLLPVLAWWQGVLQKLFGIKAQLTGDKARELAARWWICDSKKAIEKLGWTPRVDLDEGLKETGDWYREQKWL